MQRSVILSALALVFLFSASTAFAQSTLSVTGEPNFQSNYQVGLSCSWPSVSGATKYRVLHSRSNTAGSGAAFVDTTSTSSGSGFHPNSSTSACYSKTCQVWALNSLGYVIAQGSASICETGCATVDSNGNCIGACDNDGWCEAGETQSNCPLDCPCDYDFVCEFPENQFNCPSDCFGPYCTGGAWCVSNQDCGVDGFCSNGRCVCA